MNIINREQLEYHNPSTQLCPYIARVASGTALPLGFCILQPTTIQFLEGVASPTYRCAARCSVQCAIVNEQFLGGCMLHVFLLTSLVLLVFLTPPCHASWFCPCWSAVVGAVSCFISQPLLYFSGHHSLICTCT